MKIYISGLHSGPNPSAGVGIARSLRIAYPSATLIGVDYSNRSSGIHCPDLDDVWIQRPWNELDLDAYGRDIAEVLAGPALWISGLDLEILWARRTLGDITGFLAPPHESLRATAKPAILAHRQLGLKIPPFVSTAVSDWDLHAFCRQYGWRIWLKGPYYDARRIATWKEFCQARLAFETLWSTDTLYLQTHVRGNEESVAFAAYDGDLVGAVYMVKRDVTLEGKTWGGKIADVPDALVAPLRAVVKELRWTGGAELEMIRDSSGRRWLMEWNPRFPAWIHGATIAGYNLPALLVEAASGVRARTTQALSTDFHRLVYEVAVRPGYPLPPLVEPVLDATGATVKYPSAMPTLARSLHERARGSAASAPRPVRAPTVPKALMRDVGALALGDVPTPSRVLLPSVARRAFDRAARLAARARTPRCEVAIAYSIKTNPDDRFLTLARDCGFLAEAISQLEVEKARALGFAADEVILNGPGKWWPERKMSAVQAVFCDSIEELRRVIDDARSGTVPARTLGVRLRPPRVASRFGVPLDARDVFAELIAIVQTLPAGLSFGCHFHIASNVFGVEPWWQLYESVLRWAKSIETSSGTPVETLDIGGGWFPNDFDDEFARRVTDAVSRAATMLPSLTTFIFEPGRALVQPAMALATRLLEVRRSTAGPCEAVVDASIADLPLADVYPHRVLAFDAERRRWRGLGHGDGRLLGRLCMEDDVIATNLALPETARAGDLLLICDAGAYDRSMSYEFGKG